jgi:hypothetical protein
MGSEDAGFVVFGVRHRGLDRFVEQKLNIKTKRTVVDYPYISIENEVKELCYSTPTKRKPSNNEIAQIALEGLLMLEIDGNTFISRLYKTETKPNTIKFYKGINSVKRFIKTLSERQIEEHWDEIKRHKLSHMKYDEKYNEIGKFENLLRKIFE